MTRPTVVIALAFSLVSICFAQTPQDTNQQTARGHSFVLPDAVKWRPLMAGAEIAVISGDPQKEGEEFVIRIRAKAGTKIPPHWHPFDEHFTVMKGTFLVGMGEKMDQAQAQEMPAGAYAFLPKRMAHFMWAKDDAEVQLHGIGPFKTVWITSPAAR